MADTKISALTALLGADVADGDLFAIVDVSAGATKKITRNEARAALLTEAALSALGLALIYKAVVPLTDAQIKALPTTAVEIIPAPGAGKIIAPLHAWVRMGWVADYTNIDATASILFGLGPNTVLAPFDNSVQSSVSSLLAGGGPDGTNGWTIPPSWTTGVAFTKGQSGWYDSDLVNIALSIRAENDVAGNFTGGDAANTLTVTILYAIISV